MIKDESLNQIRNIERNVQYDASAKSNTALFKSN